MITPHFAPEERVKEQFDVMETNMVRLTRVRQGIICRGHAYACGDTLVLVCI